MTEDRLIKTSGADGKVVSADGGRLFKPSPREDVYIKVDGSEVENLFDYFEARVGYLEGPPVHIHTIQHETIHVIEGELTILIEDELIACKVGDMVLIPKGIKHSYVNLIEGTVARAVGNFAPGGFGTFRIELQEYLDTHQPPDMAEMTKISEKYHQVYVAPPLAVRLGLNVGRIT